MKADNSGPPPIALVTGASRGAGRGIARALGSHGCTVYVTARSSGTTDNRLGGTVEQTANEVTEVGGTGIPVRCDHSVESDVAALFERIESESGRLDLLVNNACAIQDALTTPGNFWEKPISLGRMLDVGIKSSYEASWFAAQMMVKQGGGLIAFTSSPGAVHYCYGPAYGAHKAALDKMAADMAVDLADTGVSAISVWMGGLATERLLDMIDQEPEKYSFLLDRLETPDFTGHVLWELLQDKGLHDLSGQTLIGAELGQRYGVADAEGRVPQSARETHQLAPREQYPLIIR
ncbi:SDR family NAD(P)-dependent oxidoreductase [Pontixanthobacter aquaemixtae]|uniref:SDR family NAD(P)-dependent oxidoreductase n=1 Tax=Pontixanthobacter aquaemixtae TaxID=1958940 RepID=A0A844ZQ87_9SPHN|nr:SDR family NAD(P)-dependent oxidoreductase [Pontixanthobacter aquaemixtae]MXO89933.1 SDR family NAD(P)-dependent oxidoreductase [Pontixanthobacter aquaemixtae]